MRTLVLCLLAGPALALDAPEGCTPYLTAQTADCEVDVYMRCETTEGPRNRIQNYGPEGLDTIEEATADWSLLFSVDPPGRSGLVVREGAATPISARALAETGETLFDYPIDFYLQRPIPLPTRLTGSFRLTGGEEVIDGEPLARLEMRMQIAVPAPMGPIETVQSGYYSAGFDAFFEGAGSLRMGDQVVAVDARPVAFHVPGDEGFLDLTPRFGCGTQDAAWRPLR